MKPRPVTRRPLALLLCAGLLLSTSGCLGTSVFAPSRSSRSTAKLGVHLLAAPLVIVAEECGRGLSDVTTYVPLWGLAAGILTFGILVPEWTVYSCVSLPPRRGSASPEGAIPARTRE